jgi:tetratricopeptide (TPR) repeat protein
MDLVDSQVQKGISFYNLRRYDAACQILEQVIIQEPSQFQALITLCNCYIHLNNLKKVLEYSNQLIKYYPHESIGFYFFSFYNFSIGKINLAIEAIDTSISIDPMDADYWALKANIFISLKNWVTALSFANKGIEIDPEHINCLNFRTQCLTKLDRTAELQANINEALHQNPYNSFTHANVGWSKLETKDYDNARLHFAEALRINPNNEYARDGIINAIKAKNIIFNWFLQYSFWFEKKSKNFKYGFLFAFIFFRKFLVDFAQTNPWLYIPIGLAFLFVFVTWLIEPISNFFLLLDKFGKHALTKYEKQTAYMVVSGLALAVCFSILGFIFKNEILISAAIFFITIIIVLNKYFSIPANQRPLKSSLYLMAIIFASIVPFLAVITAHEEIFTLFASAYIILIVLFTWIQPFLFQQKIKE